MWFFTLDLILVASHQKLNKSQVFSLKAVFNNHKLKSLRTVHCNLIIIMSNGRCSDRKNIHMLSFIYKCVFHRVFCNFEYVFSSSFLVVLMTIYGHNLLSSIENYSTGFSFLRFMFKSGLFIIQVYFPHFSFAGVYFR